MTTYIDPSLVPHKKLSNGMLMPVIGMGTFGSDRFTAEQVSAAVRGAIRTGYRLFDCASVYGNEHLIGQVFEQEINAGDVQREELVITSIVMTLAAFVTPLMTLLIRPLGLVPAMHWVLLCTSGVLVLSTIVRFSMMRELAVGRERREAARKKSPFAALKSYPPMLKLIIASLPLLIFILLRTLYFVQMGIKGTFLPIAVVKGLGFSNGTIGTLNFIPGGVMLLAQLLLLPRLRTLSSEKVLTVTLTTLVISMLIIVFSPANSTFLLILSTVLTAAGSVVTAILVDTSLANAIPDMERVQLLAMITVLTVVISAPFMWLGGVLSALPNIGPRLPMALISVLFAVCLVLLRITGKMKKVKVKVGQETKDEDLKFM